MSVCVCDILTVVEEFQKLLSISQLKLQVTLASRGTIKSNQQMTVSKCTALKNRLDLI